MDNVYRLFRSLKRSEPFPYELLQEQLHAEKQQCLLDFWDNEDGQLKAFVSHYYTCLSKF